MGEITDFVNLYVENSDILEERTNEIARVLQNNIKKEAPYKEGRLKRSIRVDTRVNGKFSVIVGYYDEGVAPHGDYVLFGTPPHEIRAKNAKALKTPYGYFKKVDHPGTKANDFLGRGLKATVALYGG
jgi:hypothetical protein